MPYAVEPADTRGDREVWTASAVGRPPRFYGAADRPLRRDTAAAVRTCISNSDIVLAHHRGFDSFFGTDLGDQLTRRGIEKVVLAGFTSETCVEGTGRHALEAGYYGTFINDAVGDFTEQAHRAAVDVAFPTFGHESLTVDEFLSSVDA
ncbi:cysteine hydrolase [Streptomyces sp. NBC_01549]|nr:cysteine hydrolase [Streptomyces sp. NBC_01549]